MTKDSYLVLLLFLHTSTTHRLSSFAFVITLAGLLAACSVDESWEYVENVPFESVFTVVEQTEISGSPDFPFYSIAGLTRKSDTYEFADPFGHALVQFHITSKSVVTYGEKGEGPGEFGLPLDLFHRDKRIYVLDRTNSRIQILGENGEYQSSFGIQGSIDRIVPSEDGKSFWLAGNIPCGSKRSCILAKYDFDGNRLLTTGTVAENTYVYAWVADVHDELVYVANVKSNTISVFDLSGIFREEILIESPSRIQIDGADNPSNSVSSEVGKMTKLRTEPNTSIITMFVAGNKLFVQRKRFNLPGDQYLLDIFDLTTRRAIVGIEAPHYLVNILANERHIFVSEGDNEYGRVHVIEANLVPAAL